MMPSVLRFSGVNPNPARIAWRGERNATGFPSKSISPVWALSMPKINLAVSVRPEPSSPARPTTSPLPMLRSIGAMEPGRPKFRSSTNGSRGCALRSLPPCCGGGICESALPIIRLTSSARGKVAVSYSPTNCPSRNTVIRSEIA